MFLARAAASGVHMRVLIPLPPVAVTLPCCCRQYEQDSHDQLVKTIEGQDLLPQVRGPGGVQMLAAVAWAG